MTALPAVPAGRDLPVARLFLRTVAAEGTRLRTVRTTWWFLAAAFVVIVGIGTIAGNDASGQASAEGESAWLAAAVPLVPGQFALLALALLAVTGDYATGGIVPTLQWTPRRAVLFAARALVTVGCVTVAGVLFAALAAGGALLASGSVLDLPAGEAPRALGEAALVVGCGAALAAGLGFLLRSTAGGLVVVFLVMLVLPIILGNLGYDWTTEIAQRLPGTGAAYLLTGEVQGVTTASAVGALLGWAGGALLLGLLRVVRDDANR